MKEKSPIKILATWMANDIKHIKACVDGIEIFATEDRDEMLRHIVDAEVAYVGAFDAEMLAKANKLQWVHSASAGVEGRMFPEFVESGIPLTCAKGCFANPGAEHAMASILIFNYRIDSRIRQQSQRRRPEWFLPTELKGKTIGIIGLGGIGRALAQKARCFEMQVIGMTRQAHDLSHYVDELLLPDQLPKLLSESDFVVVCVPITPETEGLIGETELRQMKETAYLIDISGRDRLYDYQAVARALREGWIAGADLDLQGTELAPDSPLWDLDNVIISRSVANSVENYALCTERFIENLRRYQDGRPLLGLVDKSAGY